VISTKISGYSDSDFYSHSPQNSMISFHSYDFFSVMISFHSYDFTTDF